jgi:PAS domain S-box-containing protein
MNLLKRIQYRLLLLIISITFFIALILSFIEVRRQSEINLILREKSSQQNAQIDTTFTLLNKISSNSVYDYSYWDDLVKFVYKPDAKWAYTNLESAFLALGLDYLWVYDKNQKYIYSFSRSGLSEIKYLPFSKDTLKFLIQKNWFKHFFFAHDSDYVEVFTAPIQPSNDYERSTDPHGFLVVGRRWNEKYEQTIEHLLSVKISLVAPIGITDLEKKVSNDRYSIQSHKIFPAWNEKPLVYFHCQGESHSLKGIADSVRLQTPIILLFGGVFVFAVYLALFYWVIKPIGFLSKGLKDEDVKSLDVIEKYQTEFSSFAKLIKEFFTQKKSLEHEILIRKEAEHQLKIMHDDLEISVNERTAELASAIELLQRERDQTQMYLDTAATMICLLDDFGNIKMMNKKGLVLLGYKEEEVIGKNWFNKCVSNADRSVVWDAFIKTINGIQSPIENTIYNVFTKSGRELNMIFQHTFISNDNLTYSGVLFSAADITDLKIIQSELVTAKMKAEEASRMKTAFFTNMSHELRTPLMGILGTSEILLEANISEDINNLANAIYKSGRRLLETVNMVLDLARFETGKEKIEFKLIDIVQVVEEVIDYFRIVALKKRLDFKTYVPENHFHAMIDDRLFRDILNNLVGNAVKFTLQGEVRIDIRKDEKNLIFRITDTGIGIPSEYLGIIFEEFRQVSEGQDRGFEGSGLGLSITKKYVEALNGKIKVKSEINIGSEFIVTIPLNHKEQKPAFYDDIKPVVPEKVNISFQKNNEKKNILVIDDDEISCEILKLYLEEIYSVDLLKNAEGALKQIEKKLYSAILIDINLGRGMSGLALVKKIRENKDYNSVPLIAETAFALEGDEREFLMAGFDFYISKPFTRGEILQVIEDGLKKSN